MGRPRTRAAAPGRRRSGGLSGCEKTWPAGDFSACADPAPRLNTAPRRRAPSLAERSGPFVYRLGRQVFNLKRGVRLPYGLPFISEKIVSVGFSFGTIPRFNGRADTASPAGYLGAAKADLRHVGPNDVLHVRRIGLDVRVRESGGVHEDRCLQICEFIGVGLADVLRSAATQLALVIGPRRTPSAGAGLCDGGCGAGASAQARRPR